MEAMEIAHISGLEETVVLWHKRDRDFETPHQL